MRTQLVDSDGNPRYTNELIHESSPYLLQHAHNPVNWEPWGKAAFARAVREDKPVFLSIGYSTCHWCHVMEHESFDNEEIAGFLNEHFVSIKLDREQHPDLDEVYMTGVQLMSGQGGWPMSNFLTQEGKPFFAGTYYPPEGFTSLLEQISTIWHERREEVLEQADKIAESIANFTSARAEVEELAEALLEQASGELLKRLDVDNGGFGRAPKFPNEPQLLLLLEQVRRGPSPDVVRALRLTLDAMYQGGIHDQVGGGFHRYSVDAQWLVPHFEKMLYNQAQLLRVYAGAYQLSGNAAYFRVARQIANYVIRDMQHADGRFYSATDADSEGHEGSFFVWRPEELASLLDEDDRMLVKDLYGVTPGGNFEGSSILHLSGPIEAFARDRGKDPAQLLDRLEGIREQLYRAREQREHPLRDEKIITAWNGMMVTALVRAASQLQEPLYLNVAMQAAEAVCRESLSDSELWRVALGSRRSVAGNLEDYAYLCEACSNLFVATFDRTWLARAEMLETRADSLFWDDSGGGYFFSLEHSESGSPLITRPKSPGDGAIASGNSVMVSALALLFEATGNPHYRERINRTMKAYSGLIKASPSGFAYMLIGAERCAGGPREEIQLAAAGHVRLTILPDDTVTRLVIDIDEGWHITAPAPDTGSAVEDGSSNTGIGIPSAFEVFTDVEVSYPEGVALAVEFQSEMLKVYSSQTVISLLGRPTRVALKLQACSSRECLVPERHQFGMGIPGLF